MRPCLALRRARLPRSAAACHSSVVPFLQNSTAASRFSSNDAIKQDSVVFSGIQPTGVPHLGNWLGALQQWVELQKTNGRLFYSIVDLHAITLPQPAEQLRQWRRETLATLIAIGLDPKRCSIFYQSDVPAHAELMWVLSCTSSLGYLSRMTTWKSKASIPDDASALDTAAKVKAKLGLLAYPVLQAADILVHGATFVPVGADQAQHLEFARECARNFNATHGQQILKEPQVIFSPAARVMSLRDPTSKMSKSAQDPRSRIVLTDNEETIRLKVKVSLTDSIDGITYEPERRPGVANLLNLLSYMDKSSLTSEDHASQLKGSSLKSLKELLADKIVERLAPVQDSYQDLTGSVGGKQRLTEIAREGAETARQNSRRTMQDVYRAIGMI